jgi:hypothetical protein
MDQQWSWRRIMRNLGAESILAGVVTARAWGGSGIVLEGNRRRLRVDNEWIMLDDDEGERRIEE